MARSYLLLLIPLLLSIHVYSKDKPPDELQISLLTCSSGDEIYAAFGHSAVRVIDREKNTDIVFDFGVFDYQEPDFVWKFTRGNLLYQLTISDFEDFMAMYHSLNRGVIEETFLLREDEKQKLFGWMLDNYKPENRYYIYDFMWDNCSTRIRDLIDSLYVYYVPANTGPLTGLSFRDNLAVYLKDKKWYKFGTDLLLGARVDKKMTFAQEMFLPDNLSANLRLYRRIDDDSALLSPAIVIVQNQPFPINRWQKYLSPLHSFILLLVLLVVLTRIKPSRGGSVTKSVFIIYGLTGLMLLFMWFGTSHYSTKANWNILWLNPLYILLCINNTGKLRNVLLWMLILIDVCILVFWRLIPQEFNTAIIPLLAISIYLKVTWMKWPPLPFSRSSRRQVQ